MTFKHLPVSPIDVVGGAVGYLPASANLRLRLTRVSNLGSLWYLLPQAWSVLPPSIDLIMGTDGRHYANGIPKG